MNDSINDGFSGARNKKSELRFEKIVPKRYFSLLKEGSDELRCFKIPDCLTREDHVDIACPDGRFILQADIYYKDRKASEKRPCIIFMHDWAAGKNPAICGDRQGCYFAYNGFVFITLYYRPPKYSPCPASIEDLKICARWLRSRAEEYAIDEKMIIAFGSSAGSQLAYMAAATNGVAKFENTCGFNMYSSDINMVLMHAALCDILHDFKDSDMMHIILGSTYKENPGKYAEYSPVCNVKPSMPPVIIINGDLDKTCSIGGARALRDKLAANGVKVELTELSGRDHRSTGYPGDLFMKLEIYRDFILKNHIRENIENEQ